MRNSVLLRTFDSPIEGVHQCVTYRRVGQQRGRVLSLRSGKHNTYRWEPDQKSCWSLNQQYIKSLSLSHSLNSIMGTALDLFPLHKRCWCTCVEVAMRCPSCAYSFPLHFHLMNIMSYGKFILSSISFFPFIQQQASMDPRSHRITWLTTSTLGCKKEKCKKKKKLPWLQYRQNTKKLIQIIDVFRSN